jgi:hypothetical protein
MPDAAAARQGVDEEKYVAAVVIPQGMTARIFVRLGDPKEIEVYSNPAMPFSASIVRTITGRMVDLISAGAAAARTAVSQLFESGRADVSQEMELLARVGAQAAQEAMTREIIVIKEQVGQRVQAEQQFDFLAYYAPGMAVLFPMFAMMTAGAPAGRARGWEHWRVVRRAGRGQCWRAKCWLSPPGFANDGAGAVHALRAGRGGRAGGCGAVDCGRSAP